jgi:hypothetical protein
MIPPSAIDSVPQCSGTRTRREVAEFAFKVEHEGRADGLPVAAEGAAADETGAQDATRDAARFVIQEHLGLHRLSFVRLIDVG